MATHSRILALENPHGQRSLAGCSPWGHRVGHDWATKHTRETLWPWVISQLVSSEDGRQDVLVLEHSELSNKEKYEDVSSVTSKRLEAELGWPPSKLLFEHSEFCSWKTRLKGASQGQKHHQLRSSFYRSLFSYHPLVSIVIPLYEALPSFKMGGILRAPSLSSVSFTDLHLIPSPCPRPQACLLGEWSFMGY